LPIFGPGGVVIAEHVFTPEREHKAFMTAGASGNLSPIVLGALPHAQQIFLSESPWDLFAVADRMGLYQDSTFALLATRGASTAQSLAHCPWPEVKPFAPGPIVVLLTQNDQSKDGKSTANQSWVAKVRKVCPFLMNLWDPPPNLHDFNDWTREGVSRPELVKNYEHLLQFSSPLPPLNDDKQSNQSAQTELDTSWLKGESVDALPDVEPTRIIEGVLHAGEKLGITAGSKSFKTWLLLYLAYCIANGLPFLGFKTKRSKVAIFDLELSRFSLKRRLKRIQQELGKGDFANLKVYAFRGKARKFCNNLGLAEEEIRIEGIEIVVIDPVYKFLLGKDESSNGMVADVLERLTEFCMEANVALIYVHHHSKGNQAGKNSLDRSSGAGSWSRDPDAVLDLTEHDDSTKEEKIFTAELTVRDFEPISNFVVRWKFPLLVRDEEGLDPEDLKQPSKGGRPKANANEAVLTALRVAECFGGLPALRAKQIAQASGLSSRSIQTALKDLVPVKVVKSAIVKWGYQLSVAERAKLPPLAEDDSDEAQSERNGDSK